MGVPALLSRLPALTDSRVTGVFFALLSGVLTGLSTPGMGPGAIAFVALVPLLAVTSGASPKRAFLLGWLAGTVSFTVSMWWTAYTMHTFGHLPYFLTVPVMLLLTAYLGIYTALFATGARWLSSGQVVLQVPLVLGAPLLWVALEYFRSHLLTGLPWNLLGLSLYPYTRLIQFADLTGIYGLSFFVVIINVSLYALLRPFIKQGGRRQAYYLNHAILLLMLPICVASYGQVRIASLSLAHQRTPTPDGPIRVTLVQPNIPQQNKWDPGFLFETVDRLERLSRAAEQPDLIVWPEAAVPLVLDRDMFYKVRVENLAKELDTHLLVGSLSRTPQQNITLNAAYLIDPQGQPVARAAKEHLVPFGEYVPLEKLLPFVRKLTDGIGDIRPGEGPATLPHPRATLGLAVCYELIFPNLVRERFKDGADLLVTITNDAWFGDSAAPEQHLATAVFRAIENRAYVVRAANTGISAMVDPYGLIAPRTRLNTEAALTVQADLRLDTPFYSRHGDLFARASVILVFLLALYAKYRGRIRSR